MPDRLTGSLQTKKGYYYAVINIWRDGKRSQRWIATGLPIDRNKRKAEAFLRTELEKMERERLERNERIRFHRLLEMWLEFQGGKIRDSTYENYKYVLNSHIIPYFSAMNIKARDLRPYHLEQYYNEKMKTLSLSSVRKHHANISSALEFGRINKMIPDNVAKDVTLPKQAKKQVGGSYTMREIAKLLNAVKGDVIEVPVTIIAQYGLRRSEALGLKWDAVDFENHCIWIRAVYVTVGTGQEFVEDTKSEASNRKLPMPESMERYLRHVRSMQLENRLRYGSEYNESGFVCTRDNGDPIKPALLSVRFHKILQRTDLPMLRLHDLRHSAATNLLHQGFSVKDVSAWLGHADVSTTLNIYSHVLAETNEQMAEALDVMAR